MDQGTLVNEQIADGRRFVERFAADGHTVQAAFWVKTAEEDLWFLYLATDLIDRQGPAAAYRAVHSSLRKLGQLRIASSQIKVVSPDDPVAREVLEIMNRRPARSATRYGGERLGSLPIEHSYIYPSIYFSDAQPGQMTAEEIGQEILRFMNRGQSLHLPPRVTLKDGTCFDGVPFSLQLGSQNALMAQFLADQEPAPRTYRLDEIASIA